MNLHKADSMFFKKKYRKAGIYYDKLYASDQIQFDTTHLLMAASCWALIKKKENTLFYLEILSKRKFENYLSVTTNPLFTFLYSENEWINTIKVMVKNKNKIIQPVATELAQILKNYKTNFIKYKKLYGQSGKSSVIIKQLKIKLDSVDSVNFIKLLSIVNTYGWKGKEYFGASSPDVIMTILLHANIQNQRKYFSIIRQGAFDGAIPKDGFAIIADNIALYEHNTQIYGSHIKVENGRNIPASIYKINEVNSRRIALGLDSLSTYIKNYNPGNLDYYYIIN